MAPPPEQQRTQFRTVLYVLFVALFMLGAGVLGTVLGLIDAYAAVAGESVDPSQKARVLAEGISLAMHWTAYGIVAALITAGSFGVYTVVRRRGKPVG